MKSINNMSTGLFCNFYAGCATVGMAIDGGKELVTNTVDTVVSTTSDITVAVASDVSDTTALEVGAGVVKTVRDEIDKQTDELRKIPKKNLKQKGLRL